LEHARPGKAHALSIAFEIAANAHAFGVITAKSGMELVGPSRRCR
jgi:hypothetical protein